MENNNLPTILPRITRIFTKFVKIRGKSWVGYYFPRPLLNQLLEIFTYLCGVKKRIMKNLSIVLQFLSKFAETNPINH
ncbi:MAG: hypothetical protein RLZZ628_1278 [Bacteroidota bacterium]